MPGAGLPQRCCHRAGVVDERKWLEVGRALDFPGRQVRARSQRLLQPYHLTPTADVSRRACARPLPFVDADPAQSPLTGRPSAATWRSAAAPADAPLTAADSSGAVQCEIARFPSAR